MSELYEFNDYHSQERMDSWYSDDDFENFSRNRRADIQAYRTARRNNEEINEEVHCLRGLEYKKSKRALRATVARQTRVLEAVLIEQDRQYRQGIYDPFLLAKASSKLSTEGRLNAIDSANRDAKEVLSQQQRILELFDSEDESDSDSYTEETVPTTKLDSKRKAIPLSSIFEGPHSPVDTSSPSWKLFEIFVGPTILSLDV